MGLICEHGSRAWDWFVYTIFVSGPLVCEYETRAWVHVWIDWLMSMDPGHGTGL